MVGWVADTESTRNIWYTVHIHTTRPLDSSKEEPITDTKITNIKKSLQSVLVEIVDFLVLFFHLVSCQVNENNCWTECERGGTVAG